MAEHNSANKLLHQYLSGLSIIFATWIVVISLRNFGPITFASLESDTVAFLFFFLVTSFFCFSIFFLIPKSGMKNNFPSESPRILKTAFACVLFCALIYPVVACYDFFIIKGGDLSAVSEVRHNDHLSGPRNSLIGAISALLSGAAPIALVLLFSMNGAEVRYKNLLYCVLFLGFAATFLSGGRNSFFIGALFVYFYYRYFLKVKKNKIKKPRVGAKIVLYTVLVVGFFYSMRMFVDRFVAQGMDPSSLVDYLAKEYNVGVFRMDFSSQTLESAYTALVYLTFYITHGFTAINSYFAIDFAPNFMGAYNFPQLSRIIDLTFGFQSFDDVNDRLLVNGAYLTLPGSLYLDFGYVGTIFFGGVFSAAIGYLTRNLMFLTLTQKILYAYLCVAAVFSPVYSLFGMGNGFSIMMLILIISFVSVVFGRVYKFKIVVV